MLFLFFIFSTQGILDTSRLPVNLGAMYFMVTMHTNPVTGVYSGYYRLVESYRDPSWPGMSPDDFKCQLSLRSDQLNLIQKIVHKSEHKNCQLNNTSGTFVIFCL